MKPGKIIAFIATTRPAEALDFYQNALGLKFSGDEPSALVFDAGGTMLRVSKVGEFSPQRYTVLGWEVADIRKAVVELARRGVAFERFPGLAADDLGIHTFPGGTEVAWFKDPDGNLLSLTQFA